jgi:regulator of replication initiation timing
MIYDTAQVLPTKIESIKSQVADLVAENERLRLENQTLQEANRDIRGLLGSVFTILIKELMRNE